MTTEQRTCSHTKADGRICNAMAVSDEDFCYFHGRARLREAAIVQALKQRRTSLCENKRGEVYRYIPNREMLFDDASAALFAALDLPPLEDQASLLVNVTSVLRALATQQVEPRVGALLLYGLQIAASSMNSRSKLQTPAEPVP